MSVLRRILSYLELDCGCPDRDLVTGIQARGSAAVRDIWSRPLVVYGGTLTLTTCALHYIVDY